MLCLFPFVRVSIGGCCSSCCCPLVLNQVFPWSRINCVLMFLKTGTISSLFKPPPPQFWDCRLLQVLCGYFGQIHRFNLDYLLFSLCLLLLSSLLQKYRPVWASCKVFISFPILYFHYCYFNHATAHFPCVDTSSLNRNKKNPTYNNLTVICFVFLQRWSRPPVTIKLLVSQFTLKALKMEYSLN